MAAAESSDHKNPYWRSLNELADTPEFRAWLQAEFPSAASEGGMSRRRWLQLMGASLALAGVAGCRWEKAEILPMAKRSPERVPGNPQRFATAMDLGGSATGLMVTSADGRPVKIEGNADHPASFGATSPLAQAVVLQMYDPDRSQVIVQQSGGQVVRHRSWQKFNEFARSHFATLGEKQGAGLHVLTEANSSPTLAALHEQLLKKLPGAKWHVYDPLPAEPVPFRAQLNLEQADVIVCLDADILGDHPAAVRYAREFAGRRDPSKAEMNRLYAIESRFSITGASADHRLAVRSQAVAALATLLEREIDALLASPDASAKDKAKRREGLQHNRRDFLFALADDLAAHRGRCVLVAGASQPASVHETVGRINAALGNAGKTVSYTAVPETDLDQVGQIRTLADAMQQGKVGTLLVLGGNPVYNAPADLGFAEALKKVETTIHLSLYRDETSRLCTWHLPQAHFLEAWGDARAYDGTYSIVQPLIEPLYGGKSAIEVLAMALGPEPVSGYDLVREQFQRIAGADGFESRWRETVHNGLLADSQAPAVEVALAEVTTQRSAEATGEDTKDDDQQVRHGPGAHATSPGESTENDDLEIVFCGDSMLYDGRFANNGWLQETPDPMTRLTWDNAALFSPATARSLGVEDSTLVRLKYRDQEITMPAYVMPGQADGSVAVQLGYGRTAAGRVGGEIHEEVAPVGVDVYALRTTEAMSFDSGLVVEPTGRKYPLASTQDHFAIDAAGKKARDERVATLIKEATLKQYEHYRDLSDEEREHVDITGHHGHHPPLESLWKEHEYKGHRWAMAIDLSKCIGCGACVVACQAENNVPVVGKERVLEGREMHWIRVDRFFKGEADDPGVVVQPVACQQCELAPCEQVCPVAATVHSSEGLNDMVYNRCVGTRYCANNCPYKVRRFNYFNYHKELAEPHNEVVKMVYNPEVTVRSRGVMEKCTYCVQRIQAAKIEAKNNDEPIADGEIKTACQQACPAGAIQFGDLSDEQSAVARAHAAVRSYAMLAELNIKPRTAYLARIRNPNPALEKNSHEKHA